MVNIVASKIHYDHRIKLPHHLKYSRAPTKEEYDSFLSLYHDEGIGGEGFHECMNFNKTDENVKIYFPPGYIPNKEKCNEKFILFSFTYKEDKELPASIIGVHANVKVLTRDRVGKKRKDIKLDKGVTDLLYHAIAPRGLTTLFSTPLKYDFKEGKYTPRFKAWGNGLRYLEEKHAIKILNVALESSLKAYEKEKDEIKKELFEEEINVITKILTDVLMVMPESDDFVPTTHHPAPPPPDKFIGHLGEEYIYREELKYAKNNGINPKEVEWLSQSLPTSVCDIKTVRGNSTKTKDHYLEVKSTKHSNFNNVYISSRQIEFFENHPNISTFVFVKFNELNEPIETRYFTIEELKRAFELNPIKYRLNEK